MIAKSPLKPHVLGLFASLLLLGGCVSGSDGGAAPTFSSEPTGTAGAMDTACIPATQNQGCRNTMQMWCDNSSKTWQQLGTCSAGKECVELPDPTLPGAKIASCEVVVQPDAGSSSGASSGGTSGSSGGTSGGGSSGGAPTGACARWLLDRESRPEGKWTGNPATCEVGELSDDAKDNALKLVNLYRFLAHMPAVVRDSKLDAKAQKCALIMRANNKISHTPPKSWKCWNAEGAEAAKKSNLSTGPGVRAVDRYMVDNGAHNAASLGHRRWILSRSLDKIGVGSTATKSSCLWVIGGKGNAARKWVAWPPDGEVPLAAFGQGGGSIDQTGWSLQSDSVNFSKATIEVTVDGNKQPIQQRLLKGGYGSKYAIAWNPQGWKAQAGSTYHVKVKGSTADFEYDVKVLACGQ